MSDVIRWGNNPTYLNKSHVADVRNHIPSFGKVPANIPSGLYDDSNLAIWVSPLIGHFLKNSELIDDAVVGTKVWQDPASSHLNFSSSETSHMMVGSAFVSNNTEEMSRVVRDVVTFLLQTTTKIYHNVLEQTQNVIDEMDIEDAEAAEIAVNRLKDMLSPIISVLPAVFIGILNKRISEPRTISFLLNQVLPYIDSLGEEGRLSVIQSLLYQERPSVRFAAVQALDNLGGFEARNALNSILANENNQLIRNLILSSLQHR